MTTHARIRQRRQERSSAAAGDLPDRLTSVDAERQYLAGVLDLMDRDERQARELVSMVAVAMFTDPDCRQVAAAILDLAVGDTWPARAHVLGYLRRKRQAEQLDAFSDPARSVVIELSKDELLTGPRAAELAREAAGEIADLHHRRQAAEMAADVSERLRRGDASADVFADLTRQLEAAADARASSKIISFKQCCDEWASHERSPVVPTGLRPFDDATQGGLPMGAITGLVAPPGGCKSAMALQLVLGALHADKALKAVYGLGEMTPAEIAERYACTGAYVYDLTPVTSDQSKKRDPRPQSSE
jgi:replicative DNA helicase